jgi:D-alanyl-D-alanine carboxypeptidase/D-alanyl-D-alanine-endopeptidase (penicillin-binding protein 4)
MKIEPGEEGFFVAIAADSSTKVKGQSTEIKMTNAKTPGLSIGTSVGGQVSGKNETQLFIPASITKVVTSALALKALGRDFRFRTEIAWDRDGSMNVARNLKVYSDGDPQVGPKRLVEVAQRIKAMGITKLMGQLTLISNDPRKDQAAPPAGMDDDDNVSCFSARAHAFNFSRNCASLQVGGVNDAKWSNANLKTQVALDLTTGKQRRLTVVPEFAELEALIGYAIKGIWAPGSVEEFDLPVADTKAWFGNSLLSELHKQGVDVSEVTPVLPSADETNSLLANKNTNEIQITVESDSMEQMLRLMNKPSDNFLADTLFRALAVQDAARDIRRAGENVIRKGVEEWLTRDGHPEYISEISLTDGAGLSRLNKVSPRAFLSLLKQFSLEPEFKLLWNSLPIAGVDGTLKHRMLKTAAEGSVHAKTGTLKGAYQLAGYIPRRDAKGAIKEYVPFVILSAASPENRSQVRALQDQTVAKLASELNAQSKIP